VQTFEDRKFIVRALRKSCQHPLYDLALSETLSPDGDDADPTWTFSMTAIEPKVGDFVGTYSFLSFDQEFNGEKYQGISTDSFEGTFAIPDRELFGKLRFATRINHGQVLEVFPERRDRVLLPFPCFLSDMPIYGANSGGPVFNRAGQVCGVNCTSYEGQDISFHMPLKGILELWARDIELIPEDPTPRNRTVFEDSFLARAPLSRFDGVDQMEINGGPLVALTAAPEETRRANDVGGTSYRFVRACAQFSRQAEARTDA
jgi:hypothetical protein